MHRLTAGLAVLGLLFLSAAPGAPLPEKQRPPITVENAEQVRPLSELPLDVWKIVWGPKRDELSFLSWEKPVEVLDALTYKSIRQVAADKKLVKFAVSPDRALLAWSENGTTAEVQDVRTGKVITIQTQNDQPAVSFSPDSKLLATGGYGTHAKLWDSSTGNLVRTLEAGREGGLTVVFSPDGKRLAVGNRNDSTRIYEVATGKLVHELPEKMTQELKFNPSGGKLAVAYVNGSIGLWDADEGKLLQVQPTGAEEVYTLDWSPKGDVLVTAGLKGKITLWETRKLIPLKELPAPEWVIQARFSPDGTRLFTSGGGAQRNSDRKVVIWGVANR
jgi:WD40 repeat protein